MERNGKTEFTDSFEEQEEQDLEEQHQQEEEQEEGGELQTISLARIQQYLQLLQQSLVFEWFVHMINI